MSDKGNRLFSESVDRMITGQRVGPGADMDADTRSALEFAQKMIDLGPSPDSQFKAALKARLMTRLAEIETGTQPRNRRSWFGSLLHEPAWQGMAAVIFLIVAGVVLWATGVFRHEATPPTITPTIAPIASTILKADARTDKSTYAAGEQVRMVITLKNVTSQPFTVDKFPPILSLMYAPTQEPVYTFRTAEAPLTLAPGQQTDFTLSWDQLDTKGTPVPAGRYYIELEDIDNHGQAVPLTLAKPAYFEVRGTNY